MNKSKLIIVLIGKYMLMFPPKKIVFLCITMLFSMIGATQSWQENIEELPLISKAYVDGVNHDWLIYQPEDNANLFKNENDAEITLSNGIISRTFRLTPNAATTSLRVLGKQK